MVIILREDRLQILLEHFDGGYVLLMPFPKQADAPNILLRIQLASKEELKKNFITCVLFGLANIQPFPQSRLAGWSDGIQILLRSFRALG
ncbi:hypothetical protein D3C72_2102480 [compost metagenome]